MIYFVSPIFGFRVFRGQTAVLSLRQFMKVVWLVNIYQLPQRFNAFWFDQMFIKASGA
jgi:hypothetical protein